MTILESSYICRFFLTVWGVLTGAWEDSRVGHALRTFGRGLADSVRNSAFCQFVWREGLLTKSWEDSVTCRLLTFLLNIPCAICRWLFGFGREIWDGSVFFRAVTGLCGMPSLCLGGFLAVMLMVPHDNWDNRWALLAAIALTALFALGCARQEKMRLEPGELGPWFVLFMAFVCYAFLSSLSWSMSVRFVGFYLAAFLFAVLAVSSVERYEQVETLVVLVMAGLTVAALYGCYQGVIGVDVVANQQDMSVNAGMPGRVYAFFDNPNNFAELLVMLLPLTYALFLNARTWRGKVGAVFSFAACGIALAYTYSRSGWLGFVLATVVFIAFCNWKLIPLLVALGLCCVPLLPETIYNRILTIGNTKDSSTSYRFAIYEASGVLMKDYWYRGVGLGSDILKQTFTGYPPMFDGNFPIHTHNNYLQVWAEMGIGAIVVFLGMLLNRIKTAIRSYTVCTDRRVKNLLAAAVAGFCGILLISIAEYTWFYARNMFTYFFLFGLIAACGKLARKSA